VHVQPYVPAHSYTYADTTINVLDGLFGFERAMAGPPRCAD
jgi:hypothetical protein